MTPPRPSRPRPRPAGVLAAVVVLLAAGPASAQNAYTWNTANPLGAWLDPADWTGGPAGTYPGVAAAASGANGNARDVARVNGFVNTGYNLGIDMTAAGGSLSVGAVHLLAGPSAQTTVSVGSSTTSGVLQLNGATVPVGGVSNVILANTSGLNLALVNATNGGNQQTTVRLGTANGVVLVNGGRSVTVGGTVTELTPGSGITLQGGGSLTLNTVNYTGATNVTSGVLTFASGGTGAVAGAVRNDGWVAYNRAGTGPTTFSGNLSGAGNWSVQTGAVSLAGTNTHTGTTYILSTANGFNPGGVVIGSAAAAGGAAARYHFHLPGSTVAAAYPIDQAVVSRIDPNSRGYVLMKADSANALDFSALPNVSLGGDGTPGGAAPPVVRTFSGTIVPHASGYRLGGDGVLTVASALGGTVPLTVTGQVTLSGANTYTGPTVIDAGAQLQAAVNNAGTPGPLGASSAAAGNLVLRGGTLVNTGPAATTDRGLTLVGTGNLSGTVTFGGDLVRNPGATLGVGGGAAVGLTTVNGVPIGSVPVNGVIPWAAVGSTWAGWNGTKLVAVGADYFTLLPPGVDNPIMNAPPTANVDAYGRDAAQTVTGNLTVNSVRMGQPVTVNAGATLTLAGGAAFLNSAGFVGGGAVTSGYAPGGGTAELYLYGPSSLTTAIQAAVVDNGPTPVRLVKAGAGNVALTRANTYSGGTAVNGGTVFLDNAAGLGTGPVTINPGAGGVIARVGGTVANPVAVAASAAGTTLGSTGVTAAAAGETRFTGDVAVNAPVTLQAGNVSGTRFSGTFSGTGDVTVTNNAFTGLFYPVVFDAAGTNGFGNLYLAQNATLQLGTNTDSGNRQIPDAANVYFAPGSSLVIRRSTGGAASTDGEAVNALVSQAPGAGSVTVFENGSAVGATFTLTVGAGGGGGEFGGRLQETGAPPRLELVKVGAGTQVLSGANTYTGGTRVEGGTLLVNNTAGLGTGTGVVTVGPDGTLGGNGRLNTGGLGTHVSGTVTAGTAAGFGRNDLAIEYGIELLPGSRYLVRVFDTGPNDASYLDVTGQGLINTDKLVLDLAGVDPVALRAAVGPGNTRVYTVMTATFLEGTGFTVGGFSVVNDPGFLPGEWAFDAFDTANGRVTVRFSPVPEPAAVLAVAAAGLGLAAARRKARGGRPVIPS